MLKIGLVGLPNVGKSSIFNFLTKRNVLVANYPFATINPNLGIMYLEDDRLKKLKEYYNSNKLSFSFVEIIDIAGLVKGASEGSGLGNEFLSNIREVDSICHVLRSFSDDNVIHDQISINPIRDYEIINLELLLSDIQQIEKKLKKKINKDFSQQEKNFNEFLLKKLLEDNNSIKKINFNEDQNKILKKNNFFFSKPFFFLINCNDEENYLIENYCNKNSVNAFSLKAKKKEYELNSKSDKLEFENSNISKLVKIIKKNLKLKFFFTVGKDEVKSWLIYEKSNARECSKLIHSTISKNFISLKVYNYSDWLIFKDEKNLEKNGKIRREGPNYIVKEGDICYFLFGKN